MWLDQQAFLWSRACGKQGLGFRATIKGKLLSQTIKPGIIKKQMELDSACCLFTLPVGTAGALNTPTGVLKSLKLAWARQQN